MLCHLQGCLQFVVTDGEATACLSPEAAGQLLTPLVKAGRFSITHLAGLPSLGLKGRQQLFRAFATSAAVVARFNKQHPVAADQQEDDSSSAGKASDGSSPQDVAAKDQQQPGAAPGKGRGGKRKEPASASAEDAPAAGRAKRTRGSSTDLAAQQQQAQQADPPTDPAAEEEEEEDDGLTEYERQRNEQIKRNQARLAALELPQMVAAMSAQVAKKPAASKGISSRRTKPAEPGELRR